MYDPTFAKSMCIRGKKTRQFFSQRNVPFYTFLCFLIFFFLLWTCIVIILKIMRLFFFLLHSPSVFSFITHRPTGETPALQISLVTHMVKSLPAVQKTWIRSWVGKIPRGEHGNPLQYSCLENPWTEKPGGLQSMESQRVRHNWETNTLTFTILEECRGVPSTRVGRPGIQYPPSFVLDKSLHLCKLSTFFFKKSLQAAKFWTSRIIIVYSLL